MEENGFQFQKIRDITLFSDEQRSLNSRLSEDEEYLYAQGNYHKLKVYHLRQQSTKLIIESRCEVPIQLLVDERNDTLITCWHYNLIFIYQYSKQCWKIKRFQRILLPCYLLDAKGLNNQNQFACSGDNKKLYIFQRNNNFFHKIQEIEGSNTFTQIHLDSQYLIAVSRSDKDDYTQNTIFVYQYQSSSSQYMLLQLISQKTYFNAVQFDNSQIIAFGGKQQCYEYTIVDQKFKLQNKQKIDAVDNKIVFFPNKNYFISGGCSKKLNIYVRKDQIWEKLKELQFDEFIYSFEITRSNTLVVPQKGGIIAFYK